MAYNYPSTSRALALGLAIALAALTGWELYLRAENYPIAPDDSKHLWAEQRELVEDLDSTGVVLIGSSRVLFNFQIHVWEEMTGIKPVMLATVGSNPMPVFKDIVENTDFKGTLIIGVTPPLYFSPMSDDNGSYEWVNSWVKNYYSRTYADQLNHLLSRIPQHYLAFLNSTEEGNYNELDLRKLIGRIVLPERVPGPPPFPFFHYVDSDRNVTMLEIVSTDTSYARLITDFWEFMGRPPAELPPPEAIEALKMEVIEANKALVQQFRERGGTVVYVRNPSQDKFRMAEKGGFPRESYWDMLIDSTGAPGYHFEDYEFMNRYRLPEWSHLATPDAREFTRDLVRRLQEDGIL